MSNTTKTQLLTSEQILERILNSKGQFVRVMWKSNPTPAAVHKKAGIVLEKRTSAVCRAGINFANLSSVQQGIAEGNRGEVQELPWGKWVLFPYSIEHNNVNYTRLYLTDVPCEVQYLVQNVQVTKDMYAEYLIPSEKSKLYSGEKPECFTIKTANILSTEDFEG